MAILYLIDTNALTDLSNEVVETLEHLAALAPEDRMYSCFVVIGEWEYGIRNALDDSRQLQIRTAGERAFALLAGIWESTPEISIEYGRIHAHLRKVGMMIPTNDVWIAAVARVHGATLVTNDQHFAHVPNITLADWSVS